MTGADIEGRFREGRWKGVKLEGGLNPLELIYLQLNAKYVVRHFIVIFTESVVLQLIDKI